MMSLAGKNVAFTGTFDAMSRAEVVQKATAAGVNVVKAVSKNTDTLVSGHTNAGIRVLQARNLGIPVIPADRFTKFLEKNTTRKAPVRSSAASAAPSRRSLFEDDGDADVAMPWEESTTRTAKKTLPEDFDGDFDAEIDGAPRFGRINVPRSRTLSARNIESFFQETEEDSSAMPWDMPESSSRRTTKVASTPARRQSVVPARRTASATTTRSAGSALKGKTIAFAGMLAFPPQKLSQLARSAGGKVGSIHSGYDVLVCGHGVSPRTIQGKPSKARSMSELSFIQACK